MAVSLKVSSLKPEILQQIYSDLTLTAKGLKSKGHKPRVAQLAIFDDTPEESLYLSYMLVISFN